MNPWKQNILDLCRNVIRFALWLALAINGAMVAIFSVVFTCAFLQHAWSWCRRVLFSSAW